MVILKYFNDNYTYIPDKEGGSPLSKSVEFYEEKEEIIYNEKKITANKGSDSIGIFGEKNPVINLTFYILSSKDIKGMQSIGLAYKFDDETFSLIHQLKKANYITQHKFALSSANDSVQSLYFGGIPQSEISNLYYAKCLVHSNSSNWGCKLDYIIINNKKVNLQKTDYLFTFNEDNVRLLAPKKFIDVLFHELFEERISKGICRYTSSTPQNIKCDCKAIKEIGNVTFVIEHTKFVFSEKDLFYEEYDECIFLIQENTNNDKEFIIGRIFLNKFLTLFDYDNGRIGFYSKNPFSKDNFVLINLLFFVSTIVSFGIIFYIYTKRFCINKYEVIIKDKELSLI